MTLIAPPQQLYEVLISILIGRGWRYLRYRHFRAALEMAEGTRSVLSLGAGKGLAEVALALEYPHVHFTISEHPKAAKGFKRAKNLVRRLKLTNVAFASHDLMARRVPYESYDLVAAVDTLQYIEDFVTASAKMVAVSQRWLYCQVPFADEKKRRDPEANQHALREFGHHVVGFDPKTLIRLFPDPVAIRGCFWRDAGIRLRERLQGSSDEGIRERCDELLGQAELDLQPGFPADRSEAQGIWILSRAPSARPRSLARRLLGLPQPNPHARAWVELDDRKLIEISGLFDAEFYARCYPEHTSSAADALGHYLAVGAEQGAWPNPRFDTSFYVSQSRIDPTRQNPLAHYISEGRARRLPTTDSTTRRVASRAMAPSIDGARRVTEGWPHPSASNGASAPIAAAAARNVGRASSEVAEVLRQSGLFDVDYYLEQNADVARRKVDPLGHFVRSGAKEGRNPNPLFDTRYYAQQAGIDGSKINPLYHYLTEGEARGLSPSARFDLAAYRASNPGANRMGKSLLAHALERTSHPRSKRLAEPLAARSAPAVDLQRVKITIVVPVFNGGEHVRRCLDAVLTQTRMPRVSLLILDDCSTDEATTAMLSEYADLPNVRLHRHAENLGFTRNVNYGLTLADRESDVVLLNSDTIVGPRWLEHLALAAHSSSRTATATALSDNAGAFSTPEVEYNATHVRWDVPSAARLSRRSASEDVQRFPTGCGFCMYMRREALDCVGELDAKRFPRGYGEENDWCLRASELGFHHVIALRSYVAHVNAVSFGAAKTELRQAARRTLEGYHPDYGLQLREAQANAQALSAQRAAFALVSQQRTPVLPRILFVTSTRTGGVPQTNADLMRGIGHVYAPLLLECDSINLTLWDATSSPAQELAAHSLSERVGILNHVSAEYDAILRDWLVRFDIEVLHVRHIAWHSLGLVRVARELCIPVVFSFHDFYTLCPSVNLVAPGARYQPGGVVEPTIAAPLWQTIDAQGFEQAKSLDARAFIEMWRRRMSRMVEACTELVTTSNAAKALLEAQLPATRRDDASFSVIPHGRNFDEFLEPPAAPMPGERLRVLVAGNIGEAKGLSAFIALLDRDTRGALELHFVGSTSAQLAGDQRVRAHGAYRRDELFGTIKRIRPHVSAILSVCPETFSHTLSESWAAGLPVVGTELGAVGERIRETGAGWTVDPLDTAAVYAELLRIGAGASDWQERVDAVKTWQRLVGAVRGVDAMSADYLAIYRRVMAARRPLLPRDQRRGIARPRVALVAKDHYPDAPPTVHVRLATPVKASQGNVAYEWVEPLELIRSGGADFDGVVVCRNAANGKVLSELARVCTSANLPVVLDLDDDLLSVPADKDVDGRYAADLAGLESILRAAPLTTVSTKELADAYLPRCQEVRVSPNVLDTALWFAPVERAARLPEGAATDAKLRVLYVGSTTHAEDLKLVLPVFERLAQSHGIALHIVGVDNGSHSGCYRIRPPLRQYDRFVPWLRSIVPFFDVAIAPLVDTPFNRRKSALKFMEYAACALPVVASAVPPYAGAIRDEVDGLLADSPDSWTRQLLRLAADPALRSRLATAAFTRARSEFVAQSCVFDSVNWRAPSASVEARG